MDRLDMAIALLQEAKAEKERLEEFEAEQSTLPPWNNNEADREEYNRFWAKWYSRIPKKSVINDNIKMARRLLLGEYMK